MNNKIITECFSRKDLEKILGMKGSSFTEWLHRQLNIQNIIRITKYIEPEKSKRKRYFYAFVGQQKEFNYEDGL